MQTPPIKLIPAEYLERVKGKVSIRQALAREANLPKVVLDRLVCDRSKSVLECAATNPGLDAEQVQQLLSACEYSVTYELNRNRKLSHEMVAIQLKDRYGVKDNSVFKNPNIKATEFVGLVEEHISITGMTSWSKRQTYVAAARNLGVGNGAIIALTESAYLRDGKDMYESTVSVALGNESLSARSIEYLLDRARRRLDGDEFLALIKTAVAHPNVSNSFVDSVVKDRLDKGANVLRELNFSEKYEASEEVLERLDQVYLTSVNEDYLSFLINNIPLKLLTPNRLATVELSQIPETLTALVLKVPSLSEEKIDRFVMHVAMRGDIKEISKLADASYLKPQHIDQMARSNSWSTRCRAAEMQNVSLETLKRLAIDGDSDVRRAARQSPKWEEVREAVEDQEKAYRFSERVGLLCRHAEEISTDLLDKYDADFPSIKHIFDAIRTLGDPKTKDLMRTFRVEESRNLMKDGIDTDTLSLLNDFF